MKFRLFVLTAGIAILGLAPLWAHHSLAAEYDQTKQIKLTGTVTSLDWRNPHAWIYLDVKDEGGAVVKWQCELGSPNAMNRAGFGPEQAKPGTEVLIDGILAKDGSKTCSTRIVKAKDGSTILRQ